MLRVGEGIFLPRAWHSDAGEEDWRDVPMVWWHAYKMRQTRRREAYLDWWWSLPCLTQLEAV